MKDEFNVFKYAINFYTRIPVSLDLTKQDNAGKSIRYISVIGWIVGLFSCITFFASAQLFSTDIAVLFSMLTSVLLTGALHEDGLADVCDGFGGGWTKEKILSIMKDSTIGVYGCLGLTFIFLFKFLTLIQLVKVLDISDCNNLQHIGFLLFIFLGGHGVSRYFAAIMMITSHYVGMEFNSKSKPVIANFAWKDFIVISVFGLLPFIYKPLFLLTLLPLVAAYFYLRKYFNKWIGGYTGDCLGATQQVAEVIFYLSILCVQNFLK